jgi:hypothetical protein
MPASSRAGRGASSWSEPVIGLALGIVAAAIMGVAPASASQIVSTSTVTNLVLGVNAKGEAMVSYTSRGKTIHVLAWGAVNAAPSPPKGATLTANAPQQVAFQLAYDGGYTKYYVDNPAAKAAVAQLRTLQGRMHQATKSHDNQERWALANQINAAYAAITHLRNAATSYWQTFTCPKYTGPALADVVAACRAPDGSFWAVQSWDRDLPDYGVTPNAAESQIEVHLAHWTGALPVLDVHTDWAYAGQWNHLWGTYSYNGAGVYGLKSTPQGMPLDSFGRNVYVDTFNSKYGQGWYRENSFLTHAPGGSWCYSVNPHGSHPAGTGSQYRLTVLGPGVTPDVSVTVPAPAPYDKSTQATSDIAFLALHDPSCVPHNGGTYQGAA